MKLIAGLGNPGKQYVGTRHNMGFVSLDKVADALGFSFDQSGFKGEYHIYRHPDLKEPILFLKPMTFMNLSGDSLQEAVSYYKIELDDIVVVYDEMAIEPGHIRLREKGSAGGHNGMADIIRKLGSQDIKRIRVGIGEPRFNPIDYVLGKPTKEEAPLIEEGTSKAAAAIKECIIHDFAHAMNAYNGK